MNKTDAKKIVASLLAAYTNYRPPDVDAAANVWIETMRGYSYEQVNAGLNLYMQSDAKGFPPVPGQIIDKIHIMIAPQELNEMEAWSLVSKAIRNSGYNSVEEFSKLPPLVQKAVGLPSQLRTWALDENYNEEVAMSGFQRAYKVELKRHEELQKMPRNVRNLIEKANIGSYSTQMAEKRQKAIESANKRKQGEIKALETHEDSVPFPERLLEKLEDIKNGEES